MECGTAALERTSVEIGHTTDCNRLLGHLGHDSCGISFRAYLREHTPGLRMLGTLASLDDRRFAQEVMMDLLKRKHTLNGSTCLRSGIEGIIAALRDSRAGLWKLQARDWMERCPVSSAQLKSRDGAACADHLAQDAGREHALVARQEGGLQFANAADVGKRM